MPKNDNGTMRPVARQVVQDPLSTSGREQLPDRSLQIAGVQAPQTPNLSAVGEANTQISSAIGGIDKLLAEHLEDNKADWVTQGKMAYQAGKTEQEMLATGNRYTAQGYRTLQTQDTVNKWFTQQQIDIQNTNKTLDPDQYQKYLTDQRKQILGGISDPDAQKVAVASFESASPRLVAAQMDANNTYNKAQRVNAFSSSLVSLGTTSTTASVQQPGQPLPVSPNPVEAPIPVSSKDRDIGIRTILGEAGNQGADGMAAVAHVLKNRASDSRWPNTVGAVALQPQQFSAWNAGPGGNSIPYNAKPGDAIYERAGQVFDTVMAGKNVDQTHGATHYYSPAGMKALVASGSQDNVVPSWLESESSKSGGQIKIGGHIFVGKSSGSPSGSAMAFAQPTDTVTQPTAAVAAISSATSADLNAVPAQEGVQATAITPTKYGNEVQDRIRQYGGLNPEDKAAATADAMRRQFDTGSDQLFRDAGGVGMLYELRAKPSDIDEVLKAKERFDKKQMNSFSVGNETFRNDILKRAESGEHLDTILQDIDTRHKQGTLDDANSRALANTAADTIRATDKKSENQSVLTNPDFLSEVGGLYQNTLLGSDFKTTVDQAKKIGEKYGASDDVMQKVIAQIASNDQTHSNELRAKAQSIAKTTATQDGVKDQVNRALAQGYGLENITGSQIKIKNDRGFDQEVSPQDYGVSLVKDKYAKQYSDQVQSGQMTAGMAKPRMLSDVYTELQNHNVVDKQFQSQIIGALSGNILDPTTKGLKKESVEAYDDWLALRENGLIKDEYLAKTVGDTKIRTLLETAFTLDSGSLSKEQALIKAHEILNDPNRDMNDKVRQDTAWRQDMANKTTQALTEKVRPDFWSGLFGQYNPQDATRISQYQNQAQAYVEKRAEASHLENPLEDAQVSLTKGIQDLKSNATHVMGNLVLPVPGNELPKVMGISGYGPDAPNDAVSHYITKHGETLWGNDWTSRKEGFTHAVGRTIASNIPFVGKPGDHSLGLERETPPVAITYNPTLKTMSVDLYKDASKNETLGQPKYFDVRDIGAAYAKAASQPSTWDKVWSGVFHGVARGIKEGAAAEDASNPVAALQ